MDIPDVFKRVNDPELLMYLERFLAKIEDYSDANRCWNWTGAKNPKGYGWFKFRGKGWCSHNWAYWLAYGNLTPNLQRDHLCRNPSCANPLDLEEVDRPTNILRGEIFNRSKTHCKRGHEFTEENTRYLISAGRALARNCRKCQALRNRGMI